MLKKFLVVVAVVAVANVGFAGLPDDLDILRRGDADSSGVVDISDPSMISQFLFAGGSAPPCANQADANDDGAVDVSDISYLTSWLYLGGPTPPAPGPYATTCSVDEEPSPGCEQSPC